MKSITFTCEVITPMFLGDATGGAELRPPAIKAALRFWWRAMHAHLSLNDMHQLETEIFGGGGDDARKSSFDVIIISNVSSNNIKNFDYSDRKPKKNLIEGIQKNNNRDLLGLQYLFYTFLYLKKEGKYIKPGSTFQIKFIFYNDKYINDVLSAFWLLTFLGNLGSRSRRGAGSFKVNEIISNGIDKIKLEFKTDDVSDIKEFYEDNISEIKQLLKIGSIKNNTHSHILDATIYIDNSTHNHTDWQSALNEIGKEMKKRRLKIVIVNSKPRPTSKLNDDESAAFGLPVKHKQYTILPKDYKRRASPIIIKIINHNGKFSWIITHLSGKFLPNNQLVKKQNNQITDIGTVNQQALNEFLTKLNSTTISVDI